MSIYINTIMNIFYRNWIKNCEFGDQTKRLIIDPNIYKTTKIKWYRLKYLKHFKLKVNAIVFWGNNFEIEYMCFFILLHFMSLNTLNSYNNLEYFLRTNYLELNRKNSKCKGEILLSICCKKKTK